MEQNTLSAFYSAIDQHFGVEVDVRDFDGELVISHDLPNSSSPKLADLFSYYRAKRSLQTLALNVKSDGLQTLARKLIAEFEVERYFFFDASVPDALHYLRQELSFFTRESDLENPPSIYEQASGVWVDELRKAWITRSAVTTHLEKKRKVCVVSPELHRREHLGLWEELRPISTSPNLSLCTDFPVEARQFFEQPVVQK